MAVLRLIRRSSLKAGQSTGVARLDDLTSQVEGILHDQDEQVEQENAADQAVELESAVPAQSLACVCSALSSAPWPCSTPPRPLLHAACAAAWLQHALEHALLGLCMLVQRSHARGPDQGGMCVPSRVAPTWAA